MTNQNIFGIIINVRKTYSRKAERFIGDIMKKETLTKIVETVVNTMFTNHHKISKISVETNCTTLAKSIDNCYSYIDLVDSGYKEDIILSHTDYNNAINIWITSRKDGKVRGYSYRLSIKTENKNQIEITAELTQTLYMTTQILIMGRY